MVNIGHYAYRKLTSAVIVYSQDDMTNSGLGESVPLYGCSGLGARELFLKLEEQHFDQISHAQLATESHHYYLTT